jgi:hypothetical protein
MPILEKNLCMRCPALFLILALITSCIFLAGCTQSSGTGPAPTAGAVTNPPPAETAATPLPKEAGTAGAAAITTTVPQQVVTIIHQVSLTRDVKDSELLFSLQVPVEWSVSTRRLANPENFIGFMYQTDLVKNNTFYIHTFTNYRSREQNYRDECQRWIPAPNRTVVTINGLTFDRFESTANGRTNVTYVMRPAGMNEAGYLSVLAFSADTNNRFEKEDFDKVVASFRYYSRDKVSTMPCEEIPRIAPPEEEAGNMRSASASGSSGGGSSGGSSAPRCSRR